MKFDTPSEKRSYVNNMFGRIAHRYDIVNRLMAGGMDIYWRKALVDAAPLAPRTRILDMATGTGDVIFTAAQRQPSLGLLVGADFTLPMLEVGQRRAADNHLPPGNRVRWTAADTLSIPFSDESFDIVTSAFLMRNVIDVTAAIQEQTRVARRGGKIITMDVPRPAPTLWGRLFRLYFHRIMPIFCGLVSGQPDAYVYLPHSADAFLNPEEYAEVMRSVGLKNVTYRTLLRGTVALHVGTK
jgi:demethylmenaquinone methyltransferase / 2-methoxy-6-polyprenyl-1,4-benzoquinol methylase